MTGRLAATLGAVFAGVAVALGAFGAHLLRAKLEPRDLEIFETAVRYQMYHAFALIAVGWLASRQAPGTSAAGWAFVVGICLFCGSLYVMVATGERWLGAVTPLGGVSFLIGWILLARAAWRS